MASTLRHIAACASGLLSPTGLERTMARTSFQGCSMSLPSNSDRTPQASASALQAGELLVRIRAAAVDGTKGSAVVATGLASSRSFMPTASRSGVSGVVEAVGDSHANFMPGDEVFGVTVPRLLRPGTEYAVLQAARLAHKPRQLAFAQAATIPTPAVMAWQMLFEHGRVERGETVVILGAERPVGAFAVQLARAHGIRNVALASSRHAARLRTLGADLVIDASPRVLEAACGHAAVVIDAAGGNALPRTLDVLGSGGIVVSCVARPQSSLLERSKANFSLCVSDVTTARLAQIAALVDRGLLTDFQCAIPGDRDALAESPSTDMPSSRRFLTIGSPSLEARRMAERRLRPLHDAEMPSTGYGVPVASNPRA